MKVTYLTPTEQVSEYVQNILVIEEHQLANPFSLPLYANGCPTLLFQTAKGRIRDSANHLTLFGQTVSPEQLLINESFTLIAYFLRPYAINSLFGIPASELKDKPIDLQLVYSSHSFQEQLLNAGDVEQMIKLIDQYFLSLIARIRTDDQLIRYATQQIIEQPFKDVLLKTQKELFVTERTFQRLFERSVGLSPNQFRKINQFNKAFQQLNRRQFSSFADIAFENGYADQSHYIRTFKEFTGLTPKEYLDLISGL